MMPTRKRFQRIALRIAARFAPPPARDCWEHVLLMGVVTTMALLALLVVAGLAGVVLAPVVLCIGLVDAGQRVAVALERRAPATPR